MNRLAFLHSLKKSLYDTIKEISLPLIEEDARKVEASIDHLLGVDWLPTDLKGELDEVSVHPVSLGKKGYYLFRKSGGEKVCALEDRCPQCGGLLHYLSYRRELKCLSCDRGFFLDREEGELQPIQAPVKEEEGVWMIGVKRNA